MTTFSILLRQLRQIRSVRQKELAARIRVHPSYLSALECGKKLPPSGEEFVSRIGLALDLTEEERRSLSEEAAASRKFHTLQTHAESPLAAEIICILLSKQRTLRPSQFVEIRQILERP